MGRNLIASRITSFGYRHGQPPAATITVDVRAVLHDPHVDPQLRHLTGHDQQVRDHVTGTPGAAGLAASITETVARLLDEAGDPAGIRVDVAIGCAGGRHRSVALAELLAAALDARGHRTEVIHRDVYLPVLPPA